MARIIVLNGSCLDVVDRCASRIAARGVELIADAHLRRFDLDAFAPQLERADAWVLPASFRTFPHAEHMRRFTNVKTLSIAASGFDWLDVDAATRAGLIVTNAPIPALSDAVAEVAIGLMLAVTRQIVRHHQLIRAGDHTRHMGTMLAGQTLGIVGLGAIGKATARRAAALGMNLIAATPQPDGDFVREHRIRIVSLDELLAQADIVSLHVRLNDRTANMIGREQLALMRPTSYLINTARRELVDEAALTDAVMRGRIAGAGLDDPPADPACPMLQSDRVVFTTHVGNRTFQCMESLLLHAVDNALDVLAGRRPVHVVNPQVYDGPQCRRPLEKTS